MNLLLRALLIVAGLVLAASVALVGAALFMLWGLRAAWSMLTGRPVIPFVVRLHPFGAFGTMMRRPQPAASRTPRADAVSGRLADVTDVEPK